MTKHSLPNGRAGQEARPEGVGRWIVAGVLAVGIGFGGFGYWSATAPLGSAVLANGVVGVEGNRKTVQHLEGGIVSEILVRDGAVVRAGDPLLRLDTTRVKADADLLEGQRRALLAQKARLRAERDGAADVAFPAELAAQDEIVLSQKNAFEARRKSVDGQVAIQRRRIQQDHAEIAAIQAQIRATNERLRLVRLEMADVAKLVTKGLERKPRHLELQREVASIDSLRAELSARIAGRQQDIIQAELEIANLQDRRQREVEAELQDVQIRLSDVEERLRAARDILSRTEIVAPQDGVVMGVRVHTVGAVLAPGSAVLDIVPSGDELIVEARVSPADIEDVRPGLPAQIVLSAYKARTTPTVEGEVTIVSADRITEPQTGAAYYLARIRISPDAVPDEVRRTLQPGMPADVMIAAGERTFLEYLLQPVTDTLVKSFRES